MKNPHIFYQKAIKCYFRIRGSVGVIFHSEVKLRQPRQFLGPCPLTCAGVGGGGGGLPLLWIPLGTFAGPQTTVLADFSFNPPPPRHQWCMLHFKVSQGAQSQVGMLFFLLTPLTLFMQWLMTGSLRSVTVELKSAEGLSEARRTCRWGRRKTGLWSVAKLDYLKMKWSVPSYVFLY